MRSIAIRNSGNVGGILSYVPPSDCTLVGAIASLPVAVSNNEEPSYNDWANNGSTSADGSWEGLYAWVTSTFWGPAKIPIPGGQPVYVAFSGAGRGLVQLIFDDPIQLT